MPVLDCGCNIIVGMVNGVVILQADHCQLHGSAGELRESLVDLIKWTDDAGNLLGLTVQQVGEFRGCLARAKTALAKSMCAKGEKNG